MSLNGMTDGSDTSSAIKLLADGKSAANGVASDVNVVSDGPGVNRPVIYHERQCKQLCAKHAINNLLQSVDAFTKSDLDLICHTLSPNTRFLNPHKSAFGLGNYDINVIISAFHSKHYETIWFDKRKDPNCLELENIKGFILNIPNPIYNSCRKWSASSLFALPTSLLSSRKHWIAVRAFDDLYYNLDSKLEFPELIGNKSQLIDYLREKKGSNDTEIFVVVSEQIAETVSWVKK